jgi:hypothetical protein
MGLEPTSSGARDLLRRENSLLHGCIGKRVMDGLLSDADVSKPDNFVCRADCTERCDPRTLFPISIALAAPPRSTSSNAVPVVPITTEHGNVPASPTNPTLAAPAAALPIPVVISGVVSVQTTSLPAPAGPVLPITPGDIYRSVTGFGLRAEPQNRVRQRSVSVEVSHLCLCCNFSFKPLFRRSNLPPPEDDCQVRQTNH